MFVSEIHANIATSDRVLLKVILESLNGRHFLTGMGTLNPTIPYHTICVYYVGFICKV